MSFGERIAIKSRREIETMREIGRATGEILLAGAGKLPAALLTRMSIRDQRSRTAPIIVLT